MLYLNEDFRISFMHSSLTSRGGYRNIKASLESLIDDYNSLIKFTGIRFCFLSFLRDFIFSKAVICVYNKNL